MTKIYMVGTTIYRSKIQAMNASLGRVSDTTIAVLEMLPNQRIIKSDSISDVRAKTTVVGVYTRLGNQRVWFAKHSKRGYNRAQYLIYRA